MNPTRLSCPIFSTFYSYLLIPHYKYISNHNNSFLFIAFLICIIKLSSYCREEFLIHTNAHNTVWMNYILFGFAQIYPTHIRWVTFKCKHKQYLQRIFAESTHQNLSLCKIQKCKRKKLQFAIYYQFINLKIKIVTP